MHELSQVFLEPALARNSLQSITANEKKECESSYDNYDHARFGKFRNSVFSQHEGLSFTQQRQAQHDAQH